MNAKEPIDWNAVAERASGMDIHQIRYAIADIHATLPHADDLDRMDGGNRGGYYRDEASILWKELRKRQKSN